MRGSVLSRRNFSIIIVSLIILAAVLAIMPGKDGKSPVTGLAIFGEVESFPIEDKCGRFMNLIQHSVQNEASCESRCQGQCRAKERSFVRIDFIEAEMGCHTCTCFCR